MQKTVCTSYSYNVEVSFIVGQTYFADTKDVSAFGSFLCFIHYTMEDVIFFQFRGVIIMTLTLTSDEI